MKKYFAYCRKSTDVEDKQLLSLDGQAEVVAEFAERKGLEIVKEFRESFSAKQAGRPIFSEMIQALSDGEADGVVAYKADRLTRNYTDLGILTSLLESGVEVWDTSYGEYTNDSNGKMMIGINTVMAKRKIDDLSEDTKRGLNQKAEMGWYPGWAPTGYVNNRLEKTIELDSKRASHIIEAFELYASGEYSLESLADKLNANGFVTRNGRGLEPSSLRTILRSPFYYGVFRWAGGLHPGKHKPLVDKATFDRVQEILDGRSPTPKPQKLAFAYRGLLRCGECGCAITAEQHTKTQKNGKTHHYVYYRCSKSRGKCSQPYIREGDLEAQFKEIFQGIKMPDYTADFVMGKLQELYQKDVSYQERIERNLGKKLANLRTEKKNLFRKMVSGKITDDEMYEELKAEIRDEISDIEAQLKKLSQNTLNWLDESSNLIKLCQYADIWFEEGKPAQKRTLIKSVASNLSLLGKKIDFTYQTPFPALIQGLQTGEWGG